MKMIKRHSTMFFIIAAALGVLLVTGCKDKDASASQVKKKLPFVQVVTASKSTISNILDLTGSVEPYRVALLTSPAGGPVVDIKVRESDQVETADKLIFIGRRKGIDATIDALRQELKKEEDNLKRVRQLVESNALPAEQLDQAKASFENVRAQLVNTEETSLDYVVTAPWAGVVSRVKVREGEFVNSQTELLELYDPASLIVRVSIPEKESIKFKTGMRVDVRLDAYPGQEFQGVIERVYPYLDAKTRTRTAEISLKEDVQLLPGMFARLRLELHTVEDALTLPVEAIYGTGAEQKVFVVANGKASAKKVSTGIEENNRIQIISGINPGDKVVTAGGEKLKDGMEVSIAGDAK